MGKLRKNFGRNLLSILLLIAFCYLMAAFNLYKSTKIFEFNLLKSDALKEFIFFVCIALPLIFFIRVCKRRNISDRDNTDETSSDKYECSSEKNEKEI